MQEFPHSRNYLNRGEMPENGGVSEWREVSKMNMGVAECRRVPA